MNGRKIQGTVDEVIKRHEEQLCCAYGWNSSDAQSLRAECKSSATRRDASRSRGKRTEQTGGKVMTEERLNFTTPLSLSELHSSVQPLGLGTSEHWGCERCT